MKKFNSYRCSFCGRSKDEALILVAGIEGHICESCVEQAQDIIEEELNSVATILKFTYLKPLHLGI